MIQIDLSSYLLLHLVLLSRWLDFQLTYFIFADKFTVLSFLEALEDSVVKTSESRQDEKDLRSQSCNRNEPMDESQ